VNFYISENDILKERRELQKKLLEVPDNRNFDVQLTLADGTVDPDLGKLDFAAPTFLPETGSVMMRALFDNHEGMLRPGQFVRAKLLGAKRVDAIKIPQRAVLQGSKGMFVYLVKDGKAAMQDVEPGEWYEKDWIINSGLNSGDVVIVDGVDKIGPGSPVDAKEMQPK
jgi:membrane fusion protein (multidrug efflux system)